MLPYRLRGPVWGKHVNDELRSASKESNPLFGGGPVQHAMEQDLTESQTRFVKSLVETSDPERDTEKHWEGGRAFRVFKQEFTDSKVTMMHLLMPTTSIDNEAYSQLIYAACLQVLRKAFQGAEFSLEHAAFAMFSLYALFESNPDPRGFNAPLELLTKRTQDENYLGIYRRPFSQNIRVDRQHYLLVLQLRELAMIRIAECRSQYYEKKSKGGKSICNCCIARDTLQVLDRLSSKWDFCEYTGPVGLEAFAGHQDNNLDEGSKTPPTQIPRAVQVSEIPPIEHFRFSSDLKDSLRQYQTKIRSIRVPQEKSFVANRFRKDLKPFFLKLQQDPWPDVEARLFETPLSEESPRKRVSFYPNLEIFEESNEHDDESIPQDDKDQQTVLVDEDKIDISGYKIVLPEEMDPTFNEHLRESIKSIIRLEKPAKNALTTSKTNGAIRAGDDLSSIGMGTSGGRRALHQLLDAANTDKRVPKYTSLPTIQTSTNYRTDHFLDTQQGLEEHVDGDIGDYVSSDLSDDEDDETSKDYASVATSAAGKEALEKLLRQVGKTDPNTRKPKQKGKRKAQAKALNQRPRKIAPSSSSSIGHGQGALETLLALARSK